jgi:hypothetical protein
MTLNAVRTFGFCGVLGGLSLFAGDMLLYFNGENTDLLFNMSLVSDKRILLSGVLALVSTWFYLLGLIHVNYAFKPATARARHIAIAMFAGILVAYGIVHGAFIAIATTAKLSTQYSIDLKSAIELAANTNDAIRLFVYPLFAMLSVVFIWQVWKKRTLYPRWMIFFFPLFAFMLQGTIGALVSGALWTVLMGGFLNLILVLFFSASTIALWNK